MRKRFEVNTVFKFKMHATGGDKEIPCLYLRYIRVNMLISITLLNGFGVNIPAGAKTLLESEWP